MSFTVEQKKVLENALDTFGIVNQTLMLSEECSEVVKATTKLIRSEVVTKSLLNNLVEEMADVQIMLEQMRLFYRIAENDVQVVIGYKIDRLNKLLESK